MINTEKKLEIFQNLNEYKKKYQEAKPFSHLVIDEYFDHQYLLNIEREFPKPGTTWWKYHNPFEKKFAFDQFEWMPALIQDFIMQLQSFPFIHFLEQVTGIDGLLPDPKLNGGGLHQIVRGGKLDIHADYNYHPLTKLDRRLNVLIYLNQDWLPSWAGALEFWDQKMTQCQKEILPLFNRLVIFSTTDISFHGHPEPLLCPEDRTRKSIALYYYTNGRPEHERSAPHSTLYQKRPQDEESPEMADLRQKRAKGRI